MSTSLDRSLLRCLLHEPNALEAVRTRIGPPDFVDPDCAALACRLWAGLDPGPEGDLARDLTACAMPSSFDWTAEAIGLAQGMIARRLKARLREHRDRLARATGVEADEVMRAIDCIAHELAAIAEQQRAPRPAPAQRSAPAVAPVVATVPLIAGWEQGGTLHSHTEHFYEAGAIQSRCGVRRATGPVPSGRRLATCRRCVTALAGDLALASLDDRRDGGRDG